MNKTIISHTHSFAVTSIMALLEVHLSELVYDLDNTVSESDILFGVILHSQQEISKNVWVWGGEGF